MPRPATSTFALPDSLSHKSDPALIAADERHFAAVSDCLAEKVADLSARLDARRRGPAGRGAQTIERDTDIRRLAADLTTLRRFGLDVCIGHYATAREQSTGRGPETVYVGRIGLTDATGTPLLVDWRTPSAEPFFAATLADPRGVAYRRRYRWSGGRIVDFWDEVFDDDDELARHVSPDDTSAFVTSLSGARTGRMRDVLATIQADQDAIIRADARGALAVDGGPGTGKTVVALHRAAYLLHEQSRSGLRRGNLLLVGPHRPYLDYVAEVLPALGEHSVQTATVADLAEAALGSSLGGPQGVPLGVAAGVAHGGWAGGLPDEPDPEAARLKSDVRMVDAIEAAVRFYEEPPEQSMVVPTEWADLRLTPADWAEAFASVEDGTPHNEAHGQIHQTLVDILVDQAAGAPEDDTRERSLRAELAADPGLGRALSRAWPMIDAGELVGDLWTVPAYLQLCAQWLTTEQIRLLQRSDPHAWTSADLPLLDAARHRLGDADRARRSQRRRTERAAELERRRQVIDEVIAADDDPEGVAPMLRHADLQEALLDPLTDDDFAAGAPRLAGPFGHIIVDEAQELTDAQWQTILRRCPSGSLTVVGDRAQSRLGFAETWQQRLERIGLPSARIATVHLSINYRTPSEIMEAAAPVIRAVRPDANVPESARSSGVPVTYGRVVDLPRVLEHWLAAHPEGVACVIRAGGSPGVARAFSDRVRTLTPAEAKGLEFDLVVVVDPESFGSGDTDSGITRAVDRYVAMTRATRQLIELRP
ncbi:RNA polymerase recycling motor ATPase HelR [Dietzia lutea]|uniref:AAA family ATPase n=1 Tax=Dietzia lutea TaxID=546160 RepID=A0A2S1RC84_9ACTN|nr:RNA polymerase recycling motor ATPase HelR [Dietzia lutea]AWH93916.1 AAA family ATPase [Dietzia lutea]